MLPRAGPAGYADGAGVTSVIGLAARRHEDAGEIDQVVRVSTAFDILHRLVPLDLLAYVHRMPAAGIHVQLVARIPLGCEQALSFVGSLRRLLDDDHREHAVSVDGFVGHVFPMSGVYGPAVVVLGRRTRALLADERALAAQVVRLLDRSRPGGSEHAAHGFHHAGGAGAAGEGSWQPGWQPSDQRTTTAVAARNRPA